MFNIFLSSTFAQVNLEWAARYNSPYNNADGASSIAVDNSGYIYVTGGITVEFISDYDYITIKYSPDGDTIWT